MVNRFSLRSVLIALCLLGLLAVSFWWLYEVSRPTAETSTGLVYHPATIDNAWVVWRDRNIRSSENNTFRVMWDGAEVATISEGQAYGMLFAVYLDEQALFDGLTHFAYAHFNELGLMAWHVGDYGEIRDAGAASDGDIDMALALVIACYRVQGGSWSVNPDLAYCDLAEALIDAIYQGQVDKPGVHPSAGIDTNAGYELLPGHTWTFANFPDGLTNLSYFSPAHFRVFLDFTGDTVWQRVIDRNYEIARLAQTAEGNCSALVPDWTTYTGEPVRHAGANDDYANWSWNAARFSWRIALDDVWYDTEEAQATIAPIGDFFASVGIGRVRANYTMAGEATDTYRSPFFTSLAAVAIWNTPNLTPISCGDANGTLRTTPQAAYDVTVRLRADDYYSDAWRLFSLLLMTEQLPHPDTFLTAQAP